MSNSGNPHSFEIKPTMGLYIQQDRSGEDAGVMLRCKPNALSHLSVKQIKKRVKSLAEDMKQDAKGENGGSTACVTLGRIVPCKDEKDAKGEMSAKKVQACTLAAGDSFATLLIFDKDGNFHASYLLNDSIHEANPTDPRTVKEYKRVLRDKKPESKAPINDRGTWRLGSLAMSRSYGDSQYAFHGHTDEAEISFKEIQLPPGGRAVVVVTTDLYEPLITTPVPGKGSKKHTVISEVVTKMLHETPAKIAEALVHKGREIYWQHEVKQEKEILTQLNEMKSMVLDSGCEEKEILQSLEQDIFAADLRLQNQLKARTDDGTVGVMFLDEQESIIATFDGHGQQVYQKDPVQCGNTIAAGLATNFKQRFTKAFRPVLGNSQNMGVSDLIESHCCTQKSASLSYEQKFSLPVPPRLNINKQTEEKKPESKVSSLIRKFGSRSKTQIYNDLKRSGFFSNNECTRKRIFAMTKSAEVHRNKFRGEIVRLMLK